MYKLPNPDSGCKREEAIGSLSHQIILRIIDRTPDPLQREERINIALDEGAISYAEAWELRQ